MNDPPLRSGPDAASRTRAVGCVAQAVTQLDRLARSTRDVADRRHAAVGRGESYRPAADSCTSAIKADVAQRTEHGGVSVRQGARTAMIGWSADATVPPEHPAGQSRRTPCRTPLPRNCASLMLDFEYEWGGREQRVPDWISLLIALRTSGLQRKTLE
jgi:hypothetical protein